MKIQTELKMDSAHKLPNYKGKCGYLHGHTWKIVVSVDADILDENEFVVDFNKIKEAVMQYDHDYLNEPQRGQEPITNPTAENMSIFFAQKIKEIGRVYPNCKEGCTCGKCVIKEYNRFNSVTIKVYESDVSFAETTI
jgi:6-pyruvoyltetrahydropterin/6-carboxytetrahydropterin synthase